MIVDNLINRLRTEMAELPRKESAVAQVVLKDPEGTLNTTVAALAERAGVSQPTVLRLCRSVGCDGFPEFKVKLAQSLVSGLPFVGATVTPDDTPAQYTAKILDGAMAALGEARRRLDTASIGAAVTALAGAHQILVFGVGGSAATAQDAAHKLARFPIPCRALTDPIAALMAVETARWQDVLLIVSNTGRTKLVNEVNAAARKARLHTVAITAPGSPLAREASVAVLVEPAENAEIFTPMASRLVHLAIVDALATGVALKLGPEAVDRLARIKAVLRTTRIPGDGEAG
ncbi:MAG: SIS domain-containing protein [Alphaproteobacteria bacterium]|nr:SIS domain-containing protein [Alphaproteobacteria bacterium]